MPIRVTADPGCASCSRRAVLRGIGVAVASSLVASACGTDVAGTLDAQGHDPDGNDPNCATGDLCLDITASPNTPLATVGGSVVVKAGAATLIVVRTSATDVAALSAICTHLGCTVHYVAASNLLLCPCHSSEFSLAGAVLRSPAIQPLKVYTATLAGNLVTIVAA